MTSKIDKEINQGGITVSGYDKKGRACTVKYHPILILRVHVGATGAVIYTAPYEPDISISLRDYNRIKPLLHEKTKITGDMK